MFSATGNAMKSIQKYPKLQEFAKKTTSLTNFETPPKIVIFMFFRKQKILV
jgi:hypothetical protein